MWPLTASVALCVTVALYEGLKRAQMCRLDDQRGTEINFELPDFLRKREAVQVRMRGYWEGWCTL